MSRKAGRTKSTQASEIDAVMRRTVTIPAMDWEAFVAWLARPRADDTGAEATRASRSEPGAPRRSAR
jgi:hypothetical protein